MPVRHERSTPRIRLISVYRKWPSVDRRRVAPRRRKVEWTTVNTLGRWFSTPSPRLFANSGDSHRFSTSVATEMCPLDTTRKNGKERGYRVRRDYPTSFPSTAFGDLTFDTSLRPNPFLAILLKPLHFTASTRSSLKMAQKATRNRPTANKEGGVTPAFDFWPITAWRKQTLWVWCIQVLFSLVLRVSGQYSQITCVLDRLNTLRIDRLPREIHGAAQNPI